MMTMMKKICFLPKILDGVVKCTRLLPDFKGASRKVISLVIISVKGSGRSSGFRPTTADRYYEEKYPAWFYQPFKINNPLPARKDPQ
jgi:hypothetical protein